MRYGGYTEPMEVLYDLLLEQRKMNEFLEQLIPKTNPIEHKPKIDGGNDHDNGNERKDATTRQRGNRRGSNNNK